MKIVLSPAKKMELKKPTPSIKYTTPLFLDEAQQVITAMRKKTPEEISKLMKLSANLGNLNWERYQNWQKEIDKTARPAIYTFNGNVYNTLDVNAITKDKLTEVNNKVRILSGLYGVLRPFDLIYPYRMEMGTKLQFDQYKNLYDFWRKKITDAFNQEMKEGELLVNLASQEYFKAIDKKHFFNPILNIEFKEYKNGHLKVISIYAKMARGLMTRFIIQNKIETKEEIKLFDIDGYRFDANLSDNDKFVFTR